MKEVLSLFTFSIGALCFGVFVADLKPSPPVQFLGRASPSIAAWRFPQRTAADRTSLPQSHCLTSSSDSE
jgi:hypothetical protein